MNAPFVRLGPEPARFPVVIAVPHAGRDYPAALLADAATAPERLAQLEDRYADLLIETAISRGATAVVARRARAWLDLNRDPREIDPATVEGPMPRDMISTVRTRSGLGLIPRRIGTGPQLWRRRYTAAEIDDRIAAIHAPYHDTVDVLLASARARFGIAVLIDCHSMPPVTGANLRERPDVVIGDRFGRSAQAGLTDRIESIIAAQGFRTARNAPYAGGYTLDRHGRPERGIHAVQIEIDRSLYLDRALDRPDLGIDRIRSLFSILFDALVDACDPRPTQMAAE